MLMDQNVCYDLQWDLSSEGLCIIVLTLLRHINKLNHGQLQARTPDYVYWNLLWKKSIFKIYYRKIRDFGHCVVEQPLESMSRRSRALACIHQMFGVF